MTDAGVAASEIPPGYEILRNQRGFSAHVGAMYVRKPLNGHTLAFGFRVFWVNRGGQPDEYGLRGRVTELADLASLPVALL